MLFSRIFSTTRNNICKSSVITQQTRFMSKREVDVILFKDVPNLGKAGTVATIKPGRARNHLIPGGFAVYKTEENIEVARSVFGDSFVVPDKKAEAEEAEASAVVLTSLDVQVDVVQRLQWNYVRKQVDINTMTFKNVITKEDVLEKIRHADMFWVSLDDIYFPHNVSQINAFGTYPVAVRIDTVDDSGYAYFDINVTIETEVDPDSKIDVSLEDV